MKREYVFEKKRKRLKDDEEVLNSMGWMATTFWKQGRWTEAEKLDVQVMKARKTVLGPKHPDTLASMHNLAYTYGSRSGTMDGGGKAGCASDGDKKDSTRARAS